jgi:hypothetical protein
MLAGRRGDVLLCPAWQTVHWYFARWKQQCVTLRVGAGYCVTSCDLGVFVEEAAESVSSGDLDVGVTGIG